MCSPCCGPCGPCAPCGPCGPCGSSCGPCGPCGPSSCVKSPELRMGILYLCDCFRFNGLQDKCPRTGCQGCSDSCFTGCCGPAQYPKSYQCMSHGIDIRRVKARCPGPPSVACRMNCCSYC